MRAGQWWPLGLAAVLGVTVAANVFLLYAANDRNAAAVEPDYYRKAMAWDSSAVQADANVALGWRVAAAILPLAADGTGAIQVRVTDRDGVPLADARIACTAIHNLDSGRRPGAETVLDGEGGGTMRAALGRPGMWELRFTITRGAARFTTTLRRDAAFAPGSRGSGS